MDLISQILVVFSEPSIRKGGSLTGNISQETRSAMKPLIEELEVYREDGTSLYLDGLPSTPKVIARACMLAEGFSYMRAYTKDEKGRITKVSFSRNRND